MQDLDLRDLAAFVAVARARNFRRVATEQRISASSLSQRMRDLEERLGVRLLNRTTLLLLRGGGCRAGAVDADQQGALR
jgi:DNA-binding transcriptional LysR family regulator